MTETKTVEVTQADIDFANELIGGFRRTTGCYYAEAKGADHWIAKASSRHRLASQSLSADEEVRRLREAMKHIELISTNHGGWFESDAWAWGQRMGSIAREALQSKDTPSHGG